MKYRKFLLLAAFALLFTACDTSSEIEDPNEDPQEDPNDNPNDEPDDAVTSILKIVATTPEIPSEGVPASGESYSVSVEANVPWGITSMSDGVSATLSIDTDTTLVVEVLESSYTVDREISVVITTTNGDVTTEWKATQQGVEAPESTSKPRLIVSTDINIDNGDPDDRQSMAHLFYYATMFDLKAIIIDWPGGYGVEATQLVIDAYRTDYFTEGYKFVEMGYPHPDDLEMLVYTASEASTLGLIGSIADESDEPLYIAAWGTISAAYTALTARPELVDKVRLMTIGTEMKSPYDTDTCGENNWNDSSGYREKLFADERFNNLWLLENNWGYNGMFDGTYPTEFMVTLQAYGALGQHITDACWSKEWARYFRIGDTPTIMYFIDNDNLDNPLQYNLGGYFVKPFPEERPNYYIDAAENSAWNYSDPCSTWSIAKTEVDNRSAEMTLRRDVMYADMLERLNTLYGK
ncbi:MAG: DUF1593 domain-containing protein [Rikenellaceae bacterium]